MRTWAAPNRTSLLSLNNYFSIKRQYRVSSGEDIRYQYILQARYIIFKLQLALFQALDFELFESAGCYQVVNGVVQVAVLDLEFDNPLPNTAEFFFS